MNSRRHPSTAAGIAACDVQTTSPPGDALQILAGTGPPILWIAPLAVQEPACIHAVLICPGFLLSSVSDVCARLSHRQCSPLYLAAFRRNGCAQYGNIGMRIDHDLPFSPIRLHYAVQGDLIPGVEGHVPCGI